MNSLEIAETFGVLVYRRRYGKRFRAHISLRFNGVDFHIDSSPGKGWNLITHAHTDHYGHRNMNNPSAVASNETAKILKITTEKRFKGRTFRIGDSLDLSGVKVRTYPTHHILGSAAFYIKSADVLITGDVKDWRDLPRCSLLITEATYGHPSHRFEDEIDKLLNAAENGAVLGAYPIGKAQRVAGILAEAGLEYTAESRISKICRSVGLKVGNSGSMIVSPSKLSRYGGYILTAQNFYRWPRIVLSDHVDYEGILKMIEHCRAEHVLFYHGSPSRELINELREMGVSASTLSNIDIYI